MKTICFVDKLNDKPVQQMLHACIASQKETLRLLEVPALSLLTPDSCDVAIINQDLINADCINDLKSFRLRVQAPILLAGKQIPVACYQQLAELRRILVVQSPLSPEAIESLLNKALSGEILEAGSLPRFLTNQPVRVIDTKTGLMIKTRMRNYSPTGAFLEYTGISMRIGSRLKLEFVNDRLGSDDVRYEAKVIWIKSGFGTEVCRGVGVQFFNDVQIF